MKEYLVVKIPHGSDSLILLGEYDNHDEANFAMNQAFSEEKAKIRSLDKVKDLYDIWVDTNKKRKSLFLRMIAVRSIFGELKSATSEDLRTESDLSDCWYKIYLMNAPIFGYQIFEQNSLESIGLTQEHAYYVCTQQEYSALQKYTSSFGVDFGSR